LVEIAARNRTVDETVDQIVQSKRSIALLD